MCDICRKLPHPTWRGKVAAAHNRLGRWEGGRKAPDDTDHHQRRYGHRRARGGASIYIYLSTLYILPENYKVKQKCHLGADASPQRSNLQVTQRKWTIDPRRMSASTLLTAARRVESLKWQRGKTTCWRRLVPRSPWPAELRGRTSSGGGNRAARVISVH